jgi:hypothetical protein
MWATGTYTSLRPFAVNRRSSSKPAEPFTPQYPFPDRRGFLKLSSSWEVHSIFLGFHSSKRLFRPLLRFFLDFVFVFSVGHLEIIVLFPVCFVDIFNFIFIVFFFFLLFLTWLKDAKRFANQFPEPLRVEWSTR